MAIEQTLGSGHASALVVTERTVTSPVALGDEEQRRARLEGLVRDHHAFVWRCARRLGVRSADVEDAVQEVFILTARKLDEIRHERAFLFQTCVYVAGHIRRHARRRPEILDNERVHAELDGRATPEESAESSEARETLEAILDLMPEALRVAFLLFELEGLTMTEIAEMTGVPLGTVASRLRRAREIFMARVERNGRGAR